MRVSDIDDLTTSTLPSLQKGNIAQMAQTMQATIAQALSPAVDIADSSPVAMRDPADVVL